MIFIWFHQLLVQILFTFISFLRYLLFFIFNDFVEILLIPVISLIFFFEDSIHYYLVQIFAYFYRSWSFWVFILFTPFLFTYSQVYIRDLSSSFGTVIQFHSFWFHVDCSTLQLFEQNCFIHSKWVTFLTFSSPFLILSIAT